MLALTMKFSRSATSERSCELPPVPRARTLRTEQRAVPFRSSSPASLAGPQTAVAEEEGVTNEINLELPVNDIRIRVHLERMPAGVANAP